MDYDGEIGRVQHNASYAAGPLHLRSQRPTAMPNFARGRLDVGAVTLVEVLKFLM